MPTINRMRSPEGLQNLAKICAYKCTAGDGFAFDSGEESRFGFVSMLPYESGGSLKLDVQGIRCGVIEKGQARYLDEPRRWLGQGSVSEHDGHFLIEYAVSGDHARGATRDKLVVPNLEIPSMIPGEFWHQELSGLEISGSVTVCPLELIEMVPFELRQCSDRLWSLRSGRDFVQVAKFIIDNTIITGEALSSEYVVLDLVTHHYKGCLRPEIDEVGYSLIGSNEFGMPVAIPMVHPGIQIA